MKVAPFLFLSSVFSVASGRLVGSSDRRGLVVTICGTKACPLGTECDDGDPTTNDVCRADGCCSNYPLCTTQTCTSDATCNDSIDTTEDVCRSDGTNMCCSNRSTGPTTCATAADCTAATPCNVANCNADNECEYADPCSAVAGFVGADTFVAPDAAGNCGKAACSIVGTTSYKCTVVDPGLTGCARTECVATPGLDLCRTDQCNVDTGCCEVVERCDIDSPCVTDTTCAVVGTEPECSYTKVTCVDNADNDCILDECQDTGGGLDQGDGTCITFDVLAGQPCVVGGAALNPGGDSGECDGNGSCVVVTTTTQATPATCSVGATDCIDGNLCTTDVCVPINDGVNPTVMTCLNPDKVCEANANNDCADDTGCDATTGDCTSSAVNDGGACDPGGLFAVGSGTCASGVCVPPITTVPVTTVAATTVAATTVPATTACTLGAKGDSCTVAGDCCKDKCNGKPGEKTCG